MGSGSKWGYEAPFRVFTTDGNTNNVPAAIITVKVTNLNNGLISSITHTNSGGLGLFDGKSLTSKRSGHFNITLTIVNNSNNPVTFIGGDVVSDDAYACISNNDPVSWKECL